MIRWPRNGRGRFMKWLILAALLCFSGPAMADSTKCQGQLSPDFARTFSADWIAAWNSHDLPRILEHYTDDFAMRSPGIVAMGAPSGILKGKTNVAAYWEKALKAQPDLTFDLIDVFAGVQSLAIHYNSRGRRENVEVLEFNADCKVVRGSAHWKS